MSGRVIYFIKYLDVASMFFKKSNNLGYSFNQIIFYFLEKIFNKKIF